MTKARHAALTTALLAALSTSTALAAGAAVAQTPSEAATMRNATDAAPTSGAQRSLALAARTRTVRGNGHLIGYRSFGRGAPIVLIEGYGVTIDDWDPRFLDRLARTHRVIVFDNRGVGRSTGAVRDLTIQAMANDAVALIRALRLRRPTVLGHSMGGKIAQEMALDHPRALSRLVLASTSPGGAGEVPLPLDVLQRILPPYDSREILDPLFSDEAAARAYIRSCERRDRRERVPLAVQRAQLRASALWQQQGAWDRLPSLRVKTLVGLGTADRLTPPGNGVHIAERIRGARLVRFRGLAHAFLMEAADRFVPILNRFVASEG
jgi:3-oxoadipate enol-lactonase